MKHFTDYRIRCAKCKTIPYIDEIIYHKYGFEVKIYGENR